MKRRTLFSLILSVLVAGTLPFAKEGLCKEQDAATVKFTKFSYQDTQGIGTEAFSMLVPAGWQFKGGIQWLLDNPAMPAAAAFTVRNPQGKEEFEVFPNQSFFWTTNQMLLSTLPSGSRYFGAEVRPMVGPLPALKEIVLGRFRQNVQGLKVVTEQPLPDLAKALGAGAQAQQGITTSASGGKIRIQYAKGGVPMEEEIYAVVESISFPIRSMTGMVTNTNWYVDYAFSFKTEQGKLDSQAKTFQTIINSFRVNPQWFNKYNQVVEHLIQGQIKHIQSVGQLSRIISQTHNEISDMMMDSYNQRQQVYDRISDNFSQYVRGVDKYYDPLEGKAVELPAGYDNAWANSLGEYIVSENPNYNPNIGSNQNWQKIERAQ